MFKKSQLLGVLSSIVLAASLAGCGGGGGGGGSGSGDDDGTGSSGGDDPSAASGAELAEALALVDTANAAGLIVTGADPDSATGAVTSNAVAGEAVTHASDDAIDLEPNSLYKVTESGMLERVGARDADGEELPRGSVQPVGLFDVNETFVVIWFWIPGAVCDDCVGDDFVNFLEQDVLPYLVRKSDGAAFAARDALGAPFLSSDGLQDPRRSHRFESDDAGNIYVSVNSIKSGTDFDSREQDELVRIDVSGIDSGDVTARILQDVDTVNSWAAAGNGDYVIYEGGSRLDEGQTVLRMVDTVSGELSELSLGAGVFPGQMHATIDGSTYALVANTEGGNRLFRVERDATGEPVEVALGELRVESVSDVDGFAGFQFFGDTSSHFERLVIDGREFLIGDGEQRGVPQFNPARHTYELRLDNVDVDGNPNPLVRLHDAPWAFFARPQDVRDARVSGDFIWYFGTRLSTGRDAIIRYDPRKETIDPATDIFEAFTDPVTGSDLDINKFRVLNSNRVYFEALRLNDGATVIGEISGDGVVTIDDVVEADEPDIFVLEPIRPSDFIVIDGRVQEWSLERRIASDPADDSLGGGNEVIHYSEWITGGDYFGLVEFDGGIDSAVRTRIRINGDQELRIDDGKAGLVVIDPATGLAQGDERSFAEFGGAAAIGSAVEFRVAEEELGRPSDYSARIARVGAGDIDGLASSYDSGAAMHTVDIELAKPIGAQELRVALDTTGFTLFVDGDETSARVSDGRTSTTIPESELEITRDAITVAIDDNSIGGGDAALDSLTEESSEEVFDELSAP